MGGINATDEDLFDVSTHEEAGLDGEFHEVGEMLLRSRRLDLTGEIVVCSHCDGFTVRAEPGMRCPECGLWIHERCSDNDCDTEELWQHLP